MNTHQIGSTKERIVGMHAALKASPSAHNAAILNRAHAELFAATGEVYSNGAFVKTRAGELVVFIAKHSIDARVLPSGSILAEENFSAPAGLLESQGNFGPYWTVIEPKLSAVRDWLGY